MSVLGEKPQKVLVRGEGRGREEEGEREEGRVFWCSCSCEGRGGGGEGERGDSIDRAQAPYGKSTRDCIAMATHMCQLGFYRLPHGMQVLRRLLSQLFFCRLHQLGKMGREGGREGGWEISYSNIAATQPNIYLVSFLDSPGMKVPLLTQQSDLVLLCHGDGGKHVLGWGRSSVRVSPIPSFQIKPSISVSFPYLISCFAGVSTQENNLFSLVDQLSQLIQRRLHFSLQASGAVCVQGGGGRTVPAQQYMTDCGVRIPGSPSCLYMINAG